MLFRNLIFNDLLNDVFPDQRLDTAELAYFVNSAILKFAKKSVLVVNINGGWSMLMLPQDRVKDQIEMWQKAEMTILRVWHLRLMDSGSLSNICSLPIKLLDAKFNITDNNPNIFFLTEKDQQRQ